MLSHLVDVVDFVAIIVYVFHLAESLLKLFEVSIKRLRSLTYAIHVSVARRCVLLAWSCGQLICSVVELFNLFLHVVDRGIDICELIQRNPLPNNLLNLVYLGLNGKKVIHLLLLYVSRQ